MVVMNDVMAYMFGFFFGKTPLIQLSPKKTWEGYLGGGLSTVALSVGLGYVMCQSTFFICPIGELREFRKEESETISAQQIQSRE